MSFIPSFSPEQDEIKIPKEIDIRKSKHLSSLANAKNVVCKFEMMLKKGENNSYLIKFIKGEYLFSELIDNQSRMSTHIFSLNVAYTISKYIKSSYININLVFCSRQTIQKKKPILTEDETKLKKLIKIVDEDNKPMEINSENKPITQYFAKESFPSIEVEYSENEQRMNTSPDIYYSEFRESIVQMCSLARLEKEILFPNQCYRVKEFDGKIKKGEEIAVIHTCSPLFVMYTQYLHLFSLYLKQKKMELDIYSIDYIGKTKGKAIFKKRVLDEFRNFAEETYYSKYKKVDLVQSTIKLTTVEKDMEFLRAIKNSVDLKYGLNKEYEEDEDAILERHYDRPIDIDVVFKMVYTQIDYVTCNENNIGIEYDNHMKIQK